MRRTRYYDFVWGIALVGCGARSELASDHDATVPDVSAQDAPEEPTLDDAPMDAADDDAAPDVASPSCPSACADNQECEKACKPSLETGRYCCDLQTNTCYAWSTKVCPEPIFDAGFD